MDIEKNDVDITKLFLWEGEVSITDQHNKEVGKAYQRLIGDKDLNQARIYGIRQSAELRERLQDKKTEEYKAFIKGMKISDRERLTAGIKLLQLTELSGDARTNVLIKLPVEPASDAPLEEHEKHQQEIDEFPDKFGDLVEEELEKLVKAEEKRLTKLSDKELLEEYTEMTINFLCQEEMSKSYIDMSVYLGTYKDSTYKKKLFKTFSSYENSAAELKNQLRDGYKTLELGISELKKSQEATPSPPLGESQEETGE
jgi:hypothetical protein